MDALQGVDISYWQGANINWSQVAGAGISFAIVKSTEGIGRHEPNALGQASGAKAAGLKVGYYHFAHAGQNTAVSEANFFADALAVLPSYDIIPTLDIETNKYNLTAQQMTQWISDFVTQAIAKGVPNIMLYSYESFFDSFLLPSTVLATSPLWLADYRSTAHVPHGWNNYNIWQYSQGGNVAGIQGHVDMNTCNELPLV